MADIEVLDGKVWPSNYVLSKLRQDLAEKLSPLVGISDAALFDHLERPKKEDHGLFSLPIPQLRLSGNPAEIAKSFAARFPTDGVFVGATSAGPFLNFHVNERIILKETINEVLSLGSEYGKNRIGAGKRVLVEHSSPNIAKPFHAGHLRSTIIGNFLKQVYLANGFETMNMNYLGDWGKQYGLLAVGYNKYGDESKLEEDPIQHLFDVYVQINRDMEIDKEIDDQAREYFLQMEQGNEENLSLWKRFKDLSLERYSEIYKRLNVSFDIISGESLYDDLMKKLVAEMAERDLLQESKGAMVIDLQNHNLGSPIVIKKDGATNYLTRDIAAAQDRFDSLRLDKSVYVVAGAQDLHLAQLFKAMERLQRPWARHMKHINYGMVKGMKTRKGQVVFLEDVLDQAKEVMHNVMKQNPEKYTQVGNPEEVADKLAVSAIVIQDFSARRIKDYDFKLERVTQFEGDTGPYLQYAHSRLCSLERKSGLGLDGRENLDLLTEKEASNLALLMARYPDVVQEARITAEPCLVVNYLLSLARTVSTALDRMWVVGQEQDLAKARLAIYTAARHVIANGLRLLGLEPLERM